MRLLKHATTAARGTTATLLGALACALVIGCGASHPLPDIAAETYLGPPLDLDASRSQYVVVMHAPNPGWVVGLDRVAEQYRHQAVFITLRHPNPAFLYPQMEVEQRIATTAPVNASVRVYVRLLAADDRDSYSPYVLATQADEPAAADATTATTPQSR